MNPAPRGKPEDVADAGAHHRGRNKASPIKARNRANAPSRWFGLEQWMLGHPRGAVETHRARNKNVMPEIARTQGPTSHPLAPLGMAAATRQAHNDGDRRNRNHRRVFRQEE